MLRQYFTGRFSAYFSCRRTLVAQIISIILLISTINNTVHAGFEIEITQQQMQAMAEKQFPIHKITLLTNITISNPQLSLVEKRLALQVDVLAKFPNQTQSQGSAKIDGALGYLANKGEFLIMQPNLVDLTINGLNSPGNKLLKGILSQQLVEQIKHVVIYRLDDKRFRDRMAKKNLKSIQIRDGVLYADMDF